MFSVTIFLNYLFGLLQAGRSNLQAGSSAEKRKVHVYSSCPSFITIYVKWSWPLIVLFDILLVCVRGRVEWTLDKKKRTEWLIIAYAIYLLIIGVGG